jgi:uncharacterized Zn finger protein
MTDFSQYGRTIRVSGGIKAQSTRGAIGESWWSRRFLNVLESFALGSRLTRGRSYARRGQVLSLSVAPGTVSAVVQGSRPRPYDVEIELRAFDDATWLAVETALAEQAIFTARLLAGEMPAQIEEVFTAAGAPLFPTGAEQLDMSCSCPDWGVPCKHVAATFYLLAEAFDADPFEILHWRGRDRATLLARLRALRDRESGTTAQPAAPGSTASGKRNAGAASSGKRNAGAAASGKRNAGAAASGRRNAASAPPPATVGAAAALAGLSSPDLAETVDRFWVAPVPLPPRPPTLDTDVDLILRQLPAPPQTIGGAELVVRLREMYNRLRINPPPLG